MEILDHPRFGLLVECNDQAGLTAEPCNRRFLQIMCNIQEADFEAHIQQFHKANRTCSSICI